MQNKVKYMEDNEDSRLSNLGVSDLEILEFKKWPLPLHHEKFRIFGILFCSISLMIIGFRMVAKNNAIQVATLDYGVECSIPEDQYNQSCTYTHTVSSKIESPIHVYYHITKFWQNHFLFVRSMSKDQFYGSDLTETTDCEGTSWGGRLDRGQDGKILVPCGLQGWSYFNDIINLTVKDASGNTKCDNCLDYDDLALKVDKTRFTKVVDSNNITFTSIVDEYDSHDGKKIRGQVDIPGLDDESLMVWLRYGATSNIKKIHSRINVDLEKGDVLEFDIISKFNTDVLGGSKSLILSQAKTFGGKHQLLSLMFILSGVLPFLATVVILIAHAYFSIKNHQEIW